MTTTDLLDRELAFDGEVEVRRGRVWKSPRPRTPGGTAAIATTVALIGLGGLVLGSATDVPASSTQTISADELGAGSMYHLVDQVQARTLWSRGITGAGVTVAVLDTGIAPVPGLRDQVVAAVDLSGEYNDPLAAFTDNHGHGTHLAGIIAGRDRGGSISASADDPGRFLGVAPDADLVSIKVAGRDGTVQPDAVIAGVEWAIAHRDELGIRVLNLAINVESDGSYLDDPLAAVVERAWAAGIVVVAAAGNTGLDGAGLGTPADDPYVITVGAVEADVTGFSTPDWTSVGNGVRNPDVAAPGAHIESLRVPGGFADVEHPEGYVDDRHFLASGSSQSAAVVSAIAALVLDAHPDLDPDSVKAAIIASAIDVPNGDATQVGAGVVRADVAVSVATKAPAQRWAPSTAIAPATARPGVGLVPARWSGNAWSGNAWSGNAWSGNAWSGNAWSGNAWSGNAWSGNAWSGNAWSGNAWSGNAWSGNAWSGNAWSGNAWSGNAWSGNAWSGNAWSGNAWSGNAWSGNAWSGNAWSGNAWSGNAWSGNAWSGNAWSGNAWSGNAWSGNAWSGNAWSGNAWSGNAWSGNAWSGNAWSGNAWS